MISDFNYKNKWDIIIEKVIHINEKNRTDKIFIVSNVIKLINYKYL
jgi:hypothetical protein